MKKEKTDEISNFLNTFDLELKEKEKIEILLEQNCVNTLEDLENQKKNLASIFIRSPKILKKLDLSGELSNFFSNTKGSEKRKENLNNSESGEQKIDSSQEVKKKKKEFTT